MEASRAGEGTKLGATAGATRTEGRGIGVGRGRAKSGRRDPASYTLVGPAPPRAHCRTAARRSML
eukprot:1898962-Pyramimonas_sp.AAC.1